MSLVMTVNVERARLDPEAVFAHPLDIVYETNLTRGPKIAALERWKQELQDRIQATGEGMAPPAGQTAAEAATIERVAKALEILRNTLPTDEH